MNILRINLSKLLIFTFTVSILVILSTSPVFSQDASSLSESTKTEDGLVFPIKELDSCTDMVSCTKYCDDPVHQNSCTAFAKEHGFYKDDQTTYATDELIEDAKNELGCDSKEACLDFCAKPDNYTACNSWAKRNEIPGGYTEEPDNPEFLETAKEVLGCDSAETCSNFCDDAANHAKCGEYANKVGIQGGEITEGPGGCQSAENCSAFCSDPANFSLCNTYAPSGDTFTGPGGCNSEESCRSYCDQNPNQCRSIEPGSNGAYVPIECGDGETHGPGGVCTDLSKLQTAVACIGGEKYWDGTACHNEPPVGITTDVPSAHFEARAEMGGCSTPGECYDYCKENAGQCKGFDPNTPRPIAEYTPYLYYTPGTEVKHEPVESMGGCDSPGACYDYCKENPNSCSGFNKDAPRPVDVYIPGTYYTPPTDIAYVTPPVTGFYTTPVYYTPPVGSIYTTPQYYTPGMYSTPSYQTPPDGSNYTTPTYYTPWAKYPTPTGEYPTPTYSTPSYYTPPTGTGYTTPYYYTPPIYTTPFYYTPGTGGYKI